MKFVQIQWDLWGIWLRLVCLPMDTFPMKTANCDQHKLQLKANTLLGIDRMACTVQAILKLKVDTLLGIDGMTCTVQAILKLNVDTLLGISMPNKVSAFNFYGMACIVQAILKLKADTLLGMDRMACIVSATPPFKG